MNLRRKKRALLFKKSRPEIRPLEAKDMGWLWAAYKVGSFKFPEGLNQEEFTNAVALAFHGKAHFLVEDDNRRFQSGRGPVGLIGIASDGQKIEPLAAVFKWATPKNILRGFVAFFNWIKNEDIAECEVRVPAADSRLLKKVMAYTGLYQRRTEIVFGVSGRKRLKVAA